MNILFCVVLGTLKYYGIINIGCDIVVVMIIMQCINELGFLGLEAYYKNIANCIRNAAAIGYVNKIEEEVNSFKEINNEIRAKVNSIETNISAIEDNVSTIEDKVSTIEDNISYIEEQAYCLEDADSCIKKKKSKIHSDIYDYDGDDEI